MESRQETTVRVLVRWMSLRDLPDVLPIEEASFEFPWTYDEFKAMLFSRNVVGMVAEFENEIVGYMLYELHRSQIRLLNFAVAPGWRRRGVGTQMILKLVGKLSAQRRTRIVLEVRETNLPAQLFFREMGFRATALLRNHYADTPEDAYRMVYRYQSRQDVFAPANRIRHRLAG
ncbi:MAG: ribosomal-protein-alanine N-acetyltransferase [Planctomycetota bacterium]|nr:MAG: ribosomal-protein-alanine N-acetyltransferase [Planctomycetota bacterium]